MSSTVIRKHGTTRVQVINPRQRVKRDTVSKKPSRRLEKSDIKKASLDKSSPQVKETKKATPDKSSSQSKKVVSQTKKKFHSELECVKEFHALLELKDGGDFAQTPIFILTLKSDLQRVQHVITKLVPKLNALGFKNIKCFQAIDAQTYDLDISFIQSRYTLHEEFKAKFRKGQLACYLSHIEIWKYCLAHNLDKVIVLEDDAVITGKFEDFCNIYHEVPKTFDLIHLYTPKHQIRHDQGMVGKSFVNKGYRQWCTVGYLISMAGMTRLEKLSRNISTPIDSHISWLVENEKIEVYSCKICPVDSVGQLGHRYQDEKLPSTIYSTDMISDLAIFSSPGKNQSYPIHYFEETNSPSSRLVSLQDKLLKCDWFHAAGSKILTWTPDKIAHLIQKEFPLIHQFAYSSTAGDEKIRRKIEIACILYHLGGVVFLPNHCEKVDDLNFRENTVIWDDKSGVVSSSKNHIVWLHVLSNPEQSFSQCLNQEFQK